MRMAEAEPKRVLLVEDVADDRELYGGFLTSAGYAVTAVGSGEEAISLALKTGFDMIVMDLGLPDMDGIQAIALLRNYSKTRRVPILTLSASTGEARAAALAAGANQALEKPCSPEELQAAVRRLADRRNRRRA
jgi:CheY-like chemotaxis protein